MNHKLLTDEAVADAALRCAGPKTARDILAAFIAHHEGERDCERCGGTGREEFQPGASHTCDDCGGTGKVRDDKLVKLSEVVALLRTEGPDSPRNPLRIAASYIERMAKEGKL